MSRAVYTFIDKHTKDVADVIEFDLIDNPGSKAWQCVVMLNSPERSLSKISPIPAVKPLPENIADQYQVLKDVVSKLNITDFPYPDPLPDNFAMVDQVLMNKLHRHFTNSCLDLWNPQYKTNNINEIHDLLDKLNLNIHELELYLPTDIKISHEKSLSEVLTFSTGLSYDIFPLRQYHSYEPADLILDGHILGKTLIESFRCQDDPNSWDTRGHMRTSGGAIMILENFRQEIYNSKDFSDWLDQHGTNKHRTYADFPLGNFVPGHKQKLKSLAQTLYKYFVKVHIVI